MDAEVENPSAEKSQLGCFLVWLNWFDAELSPKKYWRGPKSQEMRVQGDYTQHETVTSRMAPALRWAAMRAILMFH